MHRLESVMDHRRQNATRPLDAQLAQYQRAEFRSRKLLISAAQNGSIALQRTLQRSVFRTLKSAEHGA